MLTVNGTSGADTILFRQSGSKISIVGLTSSWAAAKVNSILINLHDANDYVSLDSLANGGSQALQVTITVRSGGGDETVRLANGRDVLFSGLGHTLRVAVDGSATLDGVPVTWDPPDPVPDPPVSDWFAAYLKDEMLQTLGSSYYVDRLLDRAEVMSMLLSVQDEGVVDAERLG